MPSVIRHWTLFGAVLAGSQSSAQTSTKQDLLQRKSTTSYGKLPLVFEANQGQADPQVKFLLRSEGYTASRQYGPFFTSDQDRANPADGERGYHQQCSAGSHYNHAVRAVGSSYESGSRADISIESVGDHLPLTTNTMRSLWSPILALALSVSSSAELAASKPQLHNFTQVKTERVVVGSVADISARYENGKPITVIHILEFSTDVFPKEPNLLEVRLCGDQGDRLEPAVHTNITLVYNPASQSRLTGCLSLISSEAWQDSSKWQTVTLNSNNVKRSKKREQFIQGIINGPFAN